MSALASATPGPSPSGARLVGDDLQHLIGWYWLLSSLRPESGIESVTLESAGAGNLDDVVIARKAGQPSEYWQVKAAVSAHDPLNTAWLTKPGKKGGPSILQRLYASWIKLRKTGDLSLVLATNRSLDPSDAVLKCRDYTDHLGNLLRKADATSPAGLGRQNWATHVGVSEEELCEMLDQLEWQPDASETGWRRRVRDVAVGLGIKSDEASLLAGIGYVRSSIKKTRASLCPKDVETAIKALNLREAPPKDVLVVRMLDRTAEAADATEVLDWVEYCQGDCAEASRGLRSPDDWNSKLLPELKSAADRLKAGSKTIVVRGTMRLPAWFAVGASLREVAGFDVETIQHNGIWSSRASHSGPADIEVGSVTLGTGDEIAIVVAISNDITPDTDSFIAHTIPAIGTRLAITLPGGSSPRCVTSPEQGAAVALRIRQEARAIARANSRVRIHLFLATPGALALVLGHLWDRLPPTQLYEDLGDGSYQPAFLIQ